MGEHRITPREERVLRQVAKEEEEKIMDFSKFAPSLEQLSNDSAELDVFKEPVFSPFRAHYQIPQGSIIMPPKCGHEMSGLMPFFSQKAIMIHYRTEHCGAVDALNEILEKPEGMEWKKYSIFAMMKSKDPKISTLAATVVNHNLYWISVKGYTSTYPTPVAMRGMEHSFGSYDRMKRYFKEAASKAFGSGWAWLVMDTSGELHIMITRNMEHPSVFSDDLHPILALDLWEHAYYLDYRTNVGKYIDNYWEQVDWWHVERTMSPRPDPVVMEQKEYLAKSGRLFGADIDD